MPRPKKPSTEQRRKGAYRKNPSRENKNEPKPTGAVGEPPKYFKKPQSDIWYELSQNSAKGVLTNMDRPILELASVLMARFRAATKGTGIPLSGTELTQMSKCLSLMGMTPSDRSKIIVPRNDKKKNAFSEIESYDNGTGKPALA